MRVVTTYVPDEEAAVKDQDSLDDERHKSRVRCECFFSPGVPPLDHGWLIAELKVPQPEEADLHEKGVAQETEDEAPSVVEHARIQGHNGQGVCVKWWGIMVGCVSDLNTRAQESLETYIR